MTPSYWYEEWRIECAKVSALNTELLEAIECARKALKQRDRAEKKLDSMKIMKRHADWKLRAEQAEAEVAELSAVLRAIHDNPLGNVEELQAEVERLRVCFLCSHQLDCVGDAMDDDAPLPLDRDHCHFTPSRWTERVVE